MSQFMFHGKLATLGSSCAALHPAWTDLSNETIINESFAAFVAATPLGADLDRHPQDVRMAKIHSQQSGYCPEPLQI